MTAPRHTPASGDLFWRASIVLFVVLCFGFSQRAGWAVMGTMLADHQVRRDDAALKGDLVRGDLRTAAREYEALAGTPSVGEAEAAIAALLAVYLKAGRRTVGALTDDCARPDWAPQTCRRVAEARGVLERARRRDQLKAQIDAGGARLDGTAKVADGAVEVAVPVGLAQRLGLAGWDDAGAQQATRDARFYSTVFVVFFISLVATFGFALVGVGHRDIARGTRLARENPMVVVPLVFLAVEGGMNALFGWRQAGGGLLNPAAWLQAVMYFGAAVLGAYLPTAWRRRPAPALDVPALAGWDFGPRRLAAPAPVSQERAASPAGQGAAGFASHPIQFNIGLPAAAAPGEPESRPAGQGARGSVPALAAPEAAALPPRLLPAGPIDRSRYEQAHFEQEQVDALLTFRAACVLDAPGGAIADDELYQRYWAWCGGAGLPRRPFEALFARATGLELYRAGDDRVWANVALRESVQLRRA